MDQNVVDLVAGNSLPFGEVFPRDRLGWCRRRPVPEPFRGPADHDAVTLRADEEVARRIEGHRIDLIAGETVQLAEILPLVAGEGISCQSEARGHPDVAVRR